MKLLVEYPAVAEPFVQRMAGKMLANPPAMKDFAAYVTAVSYTHLTLPTTERV